MRRLAHAGFGKAFVSSVILPEWWDADCWKKPDLLPEIEIRTARFLGLPMAIVADPNAVLSTPGYQRAQLRRVRDIDRDRLAPAIHAAVGIAAAVVRNLKAPDTVAAPVVAPPPPGGIEWRDQIHRRGRRVALEDVVDDLWTRGIPVVPVDILPEPSFQGLAAIVENRPVIVVGHKHDDPGRAAFRVCHEAGHVAHGDCAPDAPVVDEDEEIASDHEMEKRADDFALQVLTGAVEVPAVTEPPPGDFKELAKRAATVERTTGADPGAVIFSWARISGDYAMATMATKALYRATGARRILREYFAKHVDLERAPQSDQELLRAVVARLSATDAPAG